MLVYDSVTMPLRRHAKKKKKLNPTQPNPKTNQFKTMFVTPLLVPSFDVISCQK